MFLIATLALLHLLTPFWILFPLARMVHALSPLTGYWLVMLGIHGLVLAWILLNGGDSLTLLWHEE